MKKHLLDRVASGEGIDEILDEFDPGEFELDIEELHSKAYDADSQLDVAAAIQELELKTHEQIEHETALKWAARSIAAYRLNRRDEGLEYKHEALEHASQVSGDLVDKLAVRIQVEAERAGGK